MGLSLAVVTGLWPRSCQLLISLILKGDGVVDLDYLNEMMELVSRFVSSSTFTGIHSDIQAVNKLLQDCSLAPGFIDGFTSAKTVLPTHGQKLFKFLYRNRAFASSLSLPALKSFVTTTDMRLKVLKAHLRVIKVRELVFLFFNYLKFYE